MSKIVKQRETKVAPTHVGPVPCDGAMANHIQPALDGSLPEPRRIASRRKAEDFDTWLDEVRPAFERAARSGREFTTYEVADSESLPEPPDPAHHWGRLMTLLQDDHLIEKAGWTCSSRPTTHASGVRTWRGTRSARLEGAA